MDFRHSARGEFLLFSVPMTADQVGFSSFIADPADNPGNEVLVFGLNDAVPQELIDFDGTSIEVVQINPPEIVGIFNSAMLTQQVAEGDEVLLGAEFTDEMGDSHTTTIDWGDGSPLEEVTPLAGEDGGGVVVTRHVYESGGLYTATLTVTDQTGLATEATTVAVVSGVGVLDGQLQVIGTNDRDRVSITSIRARGELPERIRVRADFLSEDSGGLIRHFDANDIDDILVVLRDGNDRASIHRGVTLNATISGGNGNDVLIGGSGDDVLIGNQGRDWLFGRRGKDLLVGGDGRDRLIGGRGNDLVTGNVFQSSGEDGTPEEALQLELATLNEIHLSWVAGDQAAAVQGLEQGVSDDELRDILFRGPGDDELLTTGRDRIV